MIRGRSILRAVLWSLVALSASMIPASPASAASEHETFIDLTNALQRIADTSNRRALPPPPPPSQSSTQDFTLLGVVIAGNTRLALIQRGAGQELLPVGESVAGYRLIDVEENQATLEGQRGERLVLRMPTVGGVDGPAVPPAVQGFPR